LKKLRGLFLRASPEWVVATVLLAVTVGLQASLRASPEWSCLMALILHVFGLMNTYLAAVFIGGLWLLAPALVHRTENRTAVLRRAGKEAVNGICFGLVVTLSLYIKLLVPLLRSASYDSLYEAIDRVCFSWMNPLIALRVRFLYFHWVDSLYFLFFFGMFLVSFAVHTVYGKRGFRRVLLATLLVQSLGGMLYLAAPAIGPFLYHPSVNVLMRAAEHSFYLVRKAEMAGGVHWLSANAGRYVDFGLAAMPSLHAAGSFVFLYYAWKYVRWLGWVYTPVFAWILFGAMTTRWHYGIDLIAGLALACASIALTNLWTRAHEEARSPTANRKAVPKDRVAVAR